MYSLEVVALEAESPQVDVLRWDADLMMQSLMPGQGRADFLAEMEDEAQRIEKEGELFMHMHDRGPDELYDKLNSVLMKVGHKHFGKRDGARDMDSEYDRLVQERMELLKDRRDLREAAEDEETLKEALAEVTRKCRRLRRAAARRYKECIAEELQEAWRVRDHSRAHYLSRRLAGRRMGPRRSSYATAQRARPTAEQWVRHWQKPGPQGGMAATE